MSEDENDVTEKQVSQKSLSLEYETRDGALLLWVDESQLPRDAILDAAFTFIDRCYVYVGGPEGDRLPLRIEARSEATEAQLDSLAEEFAASLAQTTLQTRIALATGQIRDYYTARALLGTGGVTTIDELLAELDDEELEDDPLEVDVPWARPAADEE